MAKMNNKINSNSSPICYEPCGNHPEHNPSRKKGQQVCGCNCGCGGSGIGCRNT